MTVCLCCFMNQKHIGIIVLIIGIILATFVGLIKAQEDNYIEDVIMETGSCFLSDGTCLHRDRNLTLYILARSMLSYFTSFIPRKFNPLEHHHDLKKVLKILDSFPKVSHLLIHEYQHVLQFNRPNHNRAPLAFKMGYNDFPLSTKGNIYHFFSIFSKRKMLKEEFDNYGFNPIEVEARLAQWVFWKVNHFDSYSVSVLDPIFHRRGSFDEFKNTHKYILADINEKKKLLESASGKEKKRLKKQLKELEFKDHIHKKAVEYIDKLTVEADRIVKVLHEKRKHVKF